MDKKYKFGIRTDGTEEKFAQHILDCANQFEEFTLIEVGFAGGATAKAIKEVLSDNYKKPWYIVSVDLKEAYIREQPTIFRNFKEEDLNVIFSVNAKSLYKNQSKNVLYLKDSAKFLSENLYQGSVNFCFIDACHCVDHAKNDFLAVEDKICKGGLVAFHDVGEIEQGTDHQHDGKYIGVRQAIQELGLWDNSREGWELVEEIVGDRVNGGEGNNIGVFRKL